MHDVAYEFALDDLRSSDAAIGALIDLSRRAHDGETLDVERFTRVRWNTATGQWEPTDTFQRIRRADLPTNQ